MFGLGAQFGFFALGLLFSFIVICFSVFFAVKFWKFFKRFACFEIKVQGKDYKQEIITERIERINKELNALNKLARKAKK
jgi:hypothetical protein